jgi:hypothetical protein
MSLLFLAGGRHRATAALLPAAGPSRPAGNRWGARRAAGRVRRGGARLAEKSIKAVHAECPHVECDQDEAASGSRPKGGRTRRLQARPWRRGARSAGCGARARGPGAAAAGPLRGAAAGSAARGCLRSSQRFFLSLLAVPPKINTRQAPCCLPQGTRGQAKLPGTGRRRQRGPNRRAGPVSPSPA